MKKIINDIFLYDKEYFDTYVNNSRREIVYSQEYERIMENCKFGKVLDIGCGIGGFLQVFDNRWEKYGYEPSKFAAYKARQNEIFMFNDLAELENESMDVIILRGVLQHIAYPMESLTQAARILKKGGLLVILATPDTDSIIYKLFGNLPSLDSSRNWILFGHKFTTNILKRLDFENIKINHPYWENPFSNYVKDFYLFIISLFTGFRNDFIFPGNMMEIFARKRG